MAGCGDGQRLVQLAFGGELTVQYGELLPQPVPWAAIGYDLIVPVPASGKRRGYNVPELMALPLAKAMEVPLAPQALERTRAKRHQAGLPLEQRIANVAGAFRRHSRSSWRASASCWWMTSSPPAQQLPPARGTASRRGRQRIRAGLCHGGVWRTAGRHHPHP